MPNGIYDPRKWKSNADLRLIISETPMGDFETLDEKIMALRFGLETRPLCVVCNQQFTSVVTPNASAPTGFRRCCSKSCAANDTLTKDSTKATLKKRYGGHHMKNPTLVARYTEDAKRNGSYAKAKETMLSKYGVTSMFADVSTQRKIKETNRQRYGVENPMQDADILNKAKSTTIDRHGTFFNPTKSKQTMLEKYGTDNIASLDSVKKKRAETVKKNYGVEHPAQADEVKDTTRRTNLSRYGVAHPMQADSVKSRMQAAHRKTIFERLKCKLDGVVTPLFDLNDFSGTHAEYKWQCNTCDSIFEDHLQDGRVPRCFKCHPLKFGALENDLRESIEAQFGIKTERTVKICGDSKYEIDIFVPDKMIGIEFNGAYWHSDKFKSPTYHQDKTLLAKDNEIQLIHVFEDQWISNREKVLSLLAAKLGVNQTIGARKCTVNYITPKQSREFLESNHLDGSARGAAVHVGLFQKDELVMVASFGKSRFDRKYDWELYRLASLASRTITGGVSKIVKFFREKHPGTLMTYVDLSHSTGNGYLRAGFEFVGTTGPGYFYLDKNLQRISRYAAQKKHLNNILGTTDLSESEAALSLGLTKIWNCGNAIFAIK